ncbi:MAG: hypothetical protein AAF676_17380 [Pseudomonadota bacterium]
MEAFLAWLAGALAAGPLGRLGERVLEEVRVQAETLRQERDAVLEASHEAQDDLVAAHALIRDLRDELAALTAENAALRGGDGEALGADGDAIARRARLLAQSRETDARAALAVNAAAPEGFAALTTGDALVLVAADAVGAERLQDGHAAAILDHYGVAAQADGPDGLAVAGPISGPRLAAGRAALCLALAAGRAARGLTLEAEDLVALHRETERRLDETALFD